MKNNYFRLFAIFFIFLVLGFSNVFAQLPTTYWSKIYNGSINVQDSAVAMCVNSSGDVFVTGWTRGATTAEDIITIKYNPNTGDTIWVKKIVSPLADRPLAMTCDNGAVYVTGWTFSPGRDIITIKYNAATGDTTWIRRYNGSNNGGDYGFAITVDNSGNVYSAGRSDVTGGVGQKFTILKYDASGIVPSGWPVVYTGGLSTAFDEAHSVKVDGSGNVYVTGSAGSNSAADFMTMKINSSGSIQWVKKYNGSANLDDIAIGLVLDNTASNIYVGGSSNRTGSVQDYAVIKYNSNGDSVGIVFYDNGINAADVMSAISIDASNNIYVTGYSLGGTTNFDYATLKYNSNLQQQWVARNVDSGNDFPIALVVGDTNSVYITGSSAGAMGTDYLTIKYRSNGVESWRKRENGTGNGNDYASSIAFFDADHIYVTGAASFNNPPVSTVWYTLRYSNLVGIQQISTQIPNNFVLSQNYPNPFNPSTTVRFDIPKESFVKVGIFNVMGQEVETLVNEDVKAGQYKVTWDASRYASGIYFYKLIASGYVETKKMILIK